MPVPALFGMARRMIVVTVLAALVTAVPAAGQDEHALQPTAWDNTNPNDSVPVLFAFSGGISLGAYQAGVTWAMIEFIKQTRSDWQFRDTLHLPAIVIKGMTGASAGNINVLLGAVEYCDLTRGRRPQESLFWEMWVNTAWDQLFPEPRRRDTLSGDRGVLDRGHVVHHLLPEIGRHMRGAAGGSGRQFNECHIPLGVVVTRLAPGIIAFNEHVRARNQRYVALFDIHAFNGQLYLTLPPDTLLRHRGLGAQIVIPTEDGRRLTTERVFQVVQASAAYPVAFAPNVIHYRDPACVLYHLVPPGCTDVRGEAFMDGGVFDNVPAGLAVGMRKALSDERRSRVIYVDPGAAREGLSSYLQRRARSAEEVRVAGIGALRRFAGGAVPSAREYELQTFIRQELSVPETDRSWVISSTRGHPVIGEYFNAFAAFFGRPFREFDFYTGVADGFHFIASQVLCDKWRLAGIEARRLSRNEEDVRAEYARDSNLVAQPRARCIDASLNALLAHGYAMDAVGRTVVAMVLQRENQNVTMPPEVTASLLQQMQVLTAVEEATYTVLGDQRAVACDWSNLPASILCADGFDRILDRLRADSHFTRIVRAWSQEAACDPARREARFDICRSERMVAALMADRNDAMRRLIDDAFYQMRAAEEQGESRGERSHEGTVKVAEMLYRSTNHAARWGPELSPSSLPPRDWCWWKLHCVWLFQLVPHYAGGTVRLGIGLSVPGAQVGWQPTVHLGKKFFMALQVERVHLPLELDSTDYTWYWATRPSIGRNFALGWLNQVAAGVRVEPMRQPWGGHFDPVSPGGTPEISALLLLGKARISVYQARSARSTTHRRKPIVTLSAADINGLLYWFVR